jgi:glutamyl-tRNA synthetase/glutamyl-Q tRNA(Asp) synthetase
LTVDVVAAWRARFSEPPITRFAPSPTGYLHLGHVVNAIYVWGVAGALGGQVLLRIEDHDRIRSRPAFEAALLEELDWLGFVPRAGSGGHGSLVRQSDATAAYADALDRLSRTHHVYACACSRRDIGGERYRGRCRDRNLPLAPGFGIRVVLAECEERFDDLRHGPLVHRPAAQCGDLLLRDRDGHWTYQFAVVVDDARQGVTLVVRGDDLLDSTGRQILLGQMLGRSQPAAFLHHPLLFSAPGVKLSKISEDTGIRELRLAGMPPEVVIGRAAAAAGLMAAAHPVAARDVAALFRAPRPDPRP